MTEPGADVSGGRVEVVDLLRGLAALAVAWFHFTNGNAAFLPEGSILKASGRHGWLGVEVFFVLSGFIIPLSMARGGYRLTRDAGRFVVKRLIRLDPPYLASIGLALGLWYASSLAPGFTGTAPDLSGRQLALHLGYLNAFAGEPWLNPVYWTLAVEFQFYLFAAVAFPALWRSGPPATAALCVGLTGLSAAAPDDRFLPHWLPLFLLGTLAARRRAGTLPAGWFWPPFVGTAAAAGWLTSPAAAGVGAAAAAAILFLRAPVPAPLAGLGAVSYSLYLVHVPVGGRVVNLGTGLQDGTAVQVAVLTAALAASLLTAWAFWALIERPAQRWSSAIRYRREAPAVLDKRADPAMRRPGAGAAPW